MKSLFAILCLLVSVNANSAESAAYTPDEALADALSSPLQFVGKGMLYGYETIESCLFKNDKVLVLHGYCISPEAPAADIQLYSPNRGQLVAVHAESLNDATPISLTNPKTYPPEFWYVFLGSLQQDELSLNTSFSDFANFYQNRYSKFPPNCIVGESGSKCDSSMNEYRKIWLPAAKSFREHPSSSWRQILNTLKKLTP